MVMMAAPKRETLPLPILEVAHWRVVIRPETFDPHRIDSVHKCEEIVRSCAVRTRVWEYPYFDDANVENGPEFVASWTEDAQAKEYWRYFKSGQFVSLCTLREDGQVRDEMTERIHTRIGCIPEGYTGTVDPDWTVDRLTEIFEFAARLAERRALGESPVVEVSWIGIGGRVLWPYRDNPGWRRIYQVHGPSHSHPLSTLDALTLIAGRRELALDAALDFFERFRWSPPRDLLRAEQDRFFARIP